MKTAKKGYFDPFLSAVVLPKMVQVSIHYGNDCIKNVGSMVHEEVQKQAGAENLTGKTIALAIGSRGIKNLPVIAKAVIETLQKCGADVFIVPGMGSHGGATAEGQRSLLNHLGISEETMGVKIRASMEAVVIGKTGDGVPVYFDKNAAAADYTVSIARIKPHTTFRGKYESGMVKMNVIGLGKQIGADYCHLQGMANMGANIEKLGRVSLRCSNLLFSVAVIENAYDETYMIRAIPKREILDAEPDMLLLAKSLMPKIPFKNLDMLVVDEIGKDISGTGMDPNIIQRFSSEHMVGEPFIKRLVVLDMTEETDGNFSGAGFSDIATMRVFEKAEMEKGYPNALTARTTIPSKLPIFMENDLTAMKAGIKVAPDVDYENIRMVRIRNTLSMTRMEISEALMEEARALSNVQLLANPKEYVFDERGNLPKTGFLYE